MKEDDIFFFLETARGEKIACKYWKAKTHPPDHLYSHGNAEDIGRIEEFFTIWVKMGYSVFAYDYPGYGHSSGKAF